MYGSVRLLYLLTYYRHLHEPALGEDDRAQPAAVAAARVQAWVATRLPLGCHGANRVRGAYGMPEAGTRTPYVQYVGPWWQVALRLWYAHCHPSLTITTLQYGGRPRRARVS